MRAILISVKSKYVEKILNGEKTIEIRKTKPKCKLPIDVYIYCTKARKPQQDKDCVREDHLTVPHPWFKQHTHIKQQYVLGANYGECLNGKIVAKFSLNKIDKYDYSNMDYPTPAFDGDTTCKKIGDGYWIKSGELNKTCLTYEELLEYGKGEILYGWNIKDLEIFERPKDSNECGIKLIKVPQSWCYVEVDEK